MAVVFHRGATARGVDDDGVQPLPVHLGAPCLDVARRGGVAFAGFAHVMGQRPAAARAFGDDHFAALPCQQADSGVVDVGVQRLLRTARHQRHPFARCPLRGEALRVIVGADRRDRLGGHLDHRTQPRVGHQPREGPPDLRPQKCQPEPRRIGQDTRQNPPQGTVAEGPFVAFFDVIAGMIHQMHIVHARGAGRHTRQTGQAAVDVFDRLFIRIAVVLEHVLDQIDTPARAIQFVTQHLIRRACGGAKAAMHTGAQDLVAACRRGVFQLFCGECGLHESSGVAGTRP